MTCFRCLDEIEEAMAWYDENDESIWDDLSDDEYAEDDLDEETDSKLG